MPLVVCVIHSIFNVETIVMVVHYYDTNRVHVKGKLGLTEKGRFTFRDDSDIWNLWWNKVQIKAMHKGNSFLESTEYQTESFCNTHILKIIKNYVGINSTLVACRL